MKFKDDIVIIGCGVVSLVISYYLVKSGYTVQVFEKNGDPRLFSKLLNDKAGTTFSGEDARIFSLNEARHHNFGRHCQKTRLNTQFRRYFHEGGWMGMSLTKLTGDDIAWMSNFEAVSEDEGRGYDDDIISFNKESAPLWDKMKTDLPDIFREGGLIEGLLRLYQTNDVFANGIKQELSIGALRELLDLQKLRQDVPILSDAVDDGMIRQAALVKGFSVNCQSFCRSLITLLEADGVVFHWRSPVTSIRRSANGDVTGIEVRGELYRFKDYVLSSGVNSRHLLEGFASAGLVAPVYGMWVRIAGPDDQSLLPMKISRSGFAAPGAAEGANVIPGKDGNGGPVLFISSGHGYMGMQQTQPGWFWARELSRACHETAQAFFPKQYRDAINRNMFEDEPCYCIRPWTPSGLGIFESVPTDQNGNFFIVGGHSTGGFAQAPSVAQAVLKKLNGKHHIMHRLYHPGRTIRVRQKQILASRIQP